MALLFLDSFDHYATADLFQKWTSKGSSTVTIAAVGRNSTNGLQVVGTTNGASPAITKTLTPANTNTCIIGAGVSLQHTTGVSQQGTFDIFAIYDGATKHLSLRVDTSGALQVFRGDGTALGVATGALSQNTFYYIEFKAVISDTVGTAVVNVNSTNLISLSSQDTRNGGSAQWTNIKLCDTATSGTGSRAYANFDDFYLADSSGANNNDFLGPIRVAAVLPDGNGTTNNFTASAGSNFQCVDESSTNGDTDYNSSSTAGHIDLYNFAALGLTGSVRGLQTNLMQRSNGSGSETICPVVRISGANYLGTTTGISTSFTDSTQAYDVSPATSVAWTVSEIDGAEFGIKLVS